jgi:hypothetical protein
MWSGSPEPLGAKRCAVEEYSERIRSPQLRGAPSGAPLKLRQTPKLKNIQVSPPWFDM